MEKIKEIGDKLHAIYESLSPFEQIVLELCSVIYEPVSAEVVLNCLQQSALAGLDQKQLTVAEIAACRVKLAACHFLDSQGCCNDFFVEIATRKAIAAGRFERMAKAVRQELPVHKKSYGTPDEKTYKRCLREIRLDIYNRDLERFNEDLLFFFQYQDDRNLINPVAQTCNSPFDGQWFRTLPLQIQFYALHEILKQSVLKLEPIAQPLLYLQDKTVLDGIPEEFRPSFYYLLIAHLLLCGRTETARGFIAQADKEIISFGLTGWLDFLLGNTGRAINRFEQDLEKLREINKINNAYFTGLEGVFFILALLKTREYANLEKIRTIITSIHAVQPHNIFRSVYTRLLAVVDTLQNRIGLARSRLKASGPDTRNSISVFFDAISQFWIEGRIDAGLMPHLLTFYERARKHGYQWLALEYAELLRFNSPSPLYGEQAEIIKNESGMQSIITVIEQEEPWQRALKALGSTGGGAEPAPDRLPLSRLAWCIQSDSGTGEIAIFPKEQRRKAGGKWSKGRAVSLKRLCGDKKPDFLTDQDREICACIMPPHKGSGEDYRIDMERALPSLIGHPRLFLLDAPTVPVACSKGEPELVVNERDGFFHLEFFPDISTAQVLAVQETPTRFKIIAVTDDHLHIAAIVGDAGLKIPVSGQEQLFTTLARISKFMTVHSPVGAGLAGSRTVEADPRIHLHLLPYGNGFRLSMLVRPFEPDGPYLKPGKGSKNLIAEVDGQRVQVCRDLRQEEENARLVEYACPSLACENNDERDWTLEDPEECLQMLLDLQGLPDDVVVEWPEGEKLSVSPQAGLGQLHVNIRKNRDWFDVSGQLRLDEKLVLDMQRLLDLARATTSRFIPLGDGHFLALTSKLRRQLDEINTYAERGKDSIRLHPLAALALDDLPESGIKLKTDAHWQRQLDQVKAAQDIVPQIPTTLKAQLRDYQVDGYFWLARLANWGVGACLADDMGLGKTIQALAVILDRAPGGPTLVVAPTSVCMNWQAEANRFAPTLNIKFFAGRKRKKLVKNLSAFDVLVTSYGLLQQEKELLAAIDWQTIVLDEAQAIKNIMTKRSRAAMNLNGRFKLITTGTPIENHLGELWNLFHFINPGLLGTIEQFNERFAYPIERQRDRAAKKKLKKLIQPFILRRLKSHVLEELPPRTEITLQVEMTPKEAAFYEALRREALDKIEQSAPQPGRKHLQILAEIMRLRRACCNARLILPDSAIPSSKLELFGSIIDELLENRHKALVFSQFVDHLAIIREYLDRKRIDYRYLDGATSRKTRQQQVDLFQAGRGDLFLISLKAGGVGLNLTAADYVIHMDPWWNPAVEAQASDRAHRIGQQHPVTIYRLVTTNTIEEKIVRLHQEKRELADSLLDGADLSGRMSADDLLRLLYAH